VADPDLPALHLLLVGLRCHEGDLGVSRLGQPDEGVRDVDLRLPLSARHAPHRHSRQVAPGFDPVVFHRVALAIEMRDHPDRVAPFLAGPEDETALPRGAQGVKELGTPARNPQLLAQRREQREDLRNRALDLEATHQLDRPCLEIAHSFILSRPSRKVPCP